MYWDLLDGHLLQKWFCRQGPGTDWTGNELEVSARM